MSEPIDVTQIASQLLGADQDTAHQIVSRLVVDHSAMLTNRADRPGGTAVFTWRNLAGESDIGPSKPPAIGRASFLISRLQRIP